MSRSPFPPPNLTPLQTLIWRGAHPVSIMERFECRASDVLEALLAIVGKPRAPRLLPGGADYWRARLSYTR